MDTVITPYRVRQCSKCSGDTVYYCVSCSCDLCPECKENHVIDLKTTDHTIETWCTKTNYILAQEMCVRHPSQVYIKYCVPCELPVCYHCRKHRYHKQIDIKEAFETKKQQHRGTVYTIRTEALFYRPVLLTEIKADVKTCHTEFSLYQPDMLTKAHTLKDLIDKMLCDLLNNVTFDFDFKHICSKQKLDMNRHIVGLQRYVHTYEQRVIRPIKFLSFIKTALPRYILHFTPASFL